MGGKRSIPGKLIEFSVRNLNIFVKEYLGFIIAIGDAVKGRKLTDEVKVNPDKTRYSALTKLERLTWSSFTQVEMSESCKRLLNLLQRLQGKIEEFPPQEIQTR